VFLQEAFFPGLLTGLPAYYLFFPGGKSGLLPFFSMVCIKANIAVRPELVEGRNRGFITFILRQAQHERSELSLGTYHGLFLAIVGLG
jgi:hypothetical protein